MLLFLTCQSDFFLFFLGVEPFPVLLQFPFVYQAVVFEGRHFYLPAMCGVLSVPVTFGLSWLRCVHFTLSTCLVLLELLSAEISERKIKYNGYKKVYIDFSK